MKRYFQIMKAYLRGSLMYQMEYKFNFLVGGSFELIWMAMYIIFINVAFLHTKDINGWNKYQMLMLTFQGGLMDSVFTFAVVPGLKRLPELINTGKLDFLLLQPVNKKFIFINIFGIIYCIKKLHIILTPTKILIYVLLSINGFLMIYSIMFILMSLAFWFMRMDIVMGIGSELITVGNKPMSIYPNIIQKILIFIIPLFVCFNFPILYIVKGLNLYFIIYSFIATAICFMILTFIFKRGLRRYVSAGS